MVQKVVLVAFLTVIMTSCGNSSGNVEQQQLPATSVDFPASYVAVGEPFSPEKVLDVNQMQERFHLLEEGDSIQVKFRSSVNAVCKNKGCWMKLDMKGGDETMVKFKDYAFFVPRDIEGREIIVNGKAYVTEMSVGDQRHFAEDAGKSPEEVAAITQPKKTLSFLAEGVVIAEEIEAGNN